MSKTIGPPRTTAKQKGQGKNCQQQYAGKQRTNEAKAKAINNNLSERELQLSGESPFFA